MRSGDDKLPRVQSKGQSGIPIPEGWLPEWTIGRILTAGLCKYESLIDRSLTMRDVWRLHDILDLKEYIKAQEHAMQDD